MIFLSAISVALSASPPVASFISATPPSGTFILPMVFTDTSTNYPTAWVWTCKNLTPGNNTEVVFSTAQNPIFSFGVGNWSIKLKASNAAGSNSTSETYLVQVRTINDLQIFPKDHIWNVPIDTLPVDPQSADYIKTMDGYVIPHFGQKVRILPNVVDNLDGATNVTFIFRYPSISDNVPYPIPDDPFLENADRGEVDTCSGDCHMIIVDRSSKHLYELFGVGRNADGTWTAGSGAVYNLSSYTLRPPGWASADAAGLAMLPGYLRYDEVAAGKVTHPTRFSTALTQNQNVWPAISGGSYANTAYPPMGQRFRLKSSFDTSGYPYQTRIILESWKKYGLILADNAIPDQYWDVFGFGDARWDPTALDALRTVKGSDFEAVDVSSLMIDETSGKVRTISSIPETPSKTTISLFTAEDNKQNYLNVESLDLGDRLKRVVPPSENQTIAVKTTVVRLSSTTQEMATHFINLPVLFYKTGREFLYRFI